MIIETLRMMGLNQSLFVDVMFFAGAFYVAVTLILFMQLKGIMGFVYNTKMRHRNGAIIDLGGIEVALTSYKKGAKELVYEHKENRYSWTIPDGIERMLPNGSRFILASTKVAAPFYHRAAQEVTDAKEIIQDNTDEDGNMRQGSAYNIQQAAEILDGVRKMLSPKGQANTIDDRSKQIADKQMAGQNKALMYGVALGMLIFSIVGAYLILMKGMEYQLCQATIHAAQTVASTTTTTTLKPL